jgi:hypothetical protein
MYERTTHRWPEVGAVLIDALRAEFVLRVLSAGMCGAPTQKRLTFMHEPYKHAATMNANRGLLSILLVLLLRVIIILTGSRDLPEG